MAYRPGKLALLEPWPHRITLPIRITQVHGRRTVGLNVTNVVLRTLNYISSAASHVDAPLLYSQTHRERE